MRKSKRSRKSVTYEYLLGVLNVQILQVDARLCSQDEFNFEEDGVLADVCPHGARWPETLELRYVLVFDLQVANSLMMCLDSNTKLDLHSVQLEYYY
jgi:hypothetical protein